MKSMVCELDVTNNVDTANQIVKVWQIVTVIQDFVLLLAKMGILDSVAIELAVQIVLSRQQTMLNVISYLEIVLLAALQVDLMINVQEIVAKRV